LVNVAKHRAKSRGMDFNLDPQDIQNRIDKGSCELTGIPFDLTTPRAWNAPSLDRIDSSKGYTTDNVRVILYAVNVMANTWGSDKILRIASAITENRRKASNDLSDRLGRILQKRLSQYGSMEYERTWSQRVTPSGHVYWVLTASARRISDNGYSGWPSPSAKEPGGTPEQHLARKRACVERGIQMGCNAVTHLSLAVQLAGWVSPTARDHSRGVSPPRPTDTGIPLSQQVAGLTGWSTPRAEERQQHNSRDKGAALSNQALGLTGWATPTAVNWRSIQHGKNARPLQEQAGLITCSSPAGTGSCAGSVLNPAFSRWLQGYPATWDECSPHWQEWSRLQDAIASGA
jgi:hypothetical protein